MNIKFSNRIGDIFVISCNISPRIILFLNTIAAVGFEHPSLSFNVYPSTNSKFCFIPCIESDNKIL